MRHAISLSVVLLGVWLLWSGHDSPLLVALGIASCTAVVALTASMGILDEEAAPLTLPFRLVAYLPWLAWQVARSNVDVARRILMPSLPVSPRLIRVEAGPATDLGRVILANSITLTPGTVSLDIEGGRIAVHALTAEAATELLGGEMSRRVARLEGRRR